jgi:ubiquinone/menaquinone biosynthesis C-methylase UbiE
LASTTSTLFDRWAETYDRPTFQNATYRPLHDAVLSRLADSTATNVLDVGCGTGQLTLRLADHFPNAAITGVDYSIGMLNEALTRVGPNANLLRADGQRLPFAAGSMDVVVCTESFHWYTDQERAIRGFFEVLRPGGRLLIGSIAMVTDVGDVAVAQLSKAAGQPIRAVTARRMKQLLTSNGFEVLQQRRVPRIGLIPWPLLTDARRP